MRFWRRDNHDSEAIQDLLAESLELAGDRRALESFYARHPDEAEELRPLVDAAHRMQSAMAVPVRETARLQARQRFLAAAARQSRATSEQAARRLPSREPTPHVLLRPLWSTFAPAIVAAALFVVALVPIMSLTSNSALPGDWNYGFKRSAERVRLALTLDASSHLNLQLAFHQRRLSEIERLADAHRLTDPALLQEFSNETSALLRSINANPQLGPSEALKVAKDTEAQAQTLDEKVAPRVAPAVQPAVADAAQQARQNHQEAVQIAQSKEESTAARTQSPAPSSTPRNGSAASPKPGSSPTPKPSPTATATASGSPSPSPSASASASPSATPSASPSPAASPVLTPPVALAIPTATPLVPPLRTPAPILLPPPAPTPRPVPPPVTIPAPAPDPTPNVIAPPRTPVPTPTPLVVPLQPPPSTQRYTQPLSPGQTTSIVYIGPPLPIPQALASISGAYDAVYYTQPRTRGSQVYEWYPGRSDPNEVLEPGSQVSIHIKPGVPATLTYPIGP